MSCAKKPRSNLVVGRRAAGFFSLCAYICALNGCTSTVAPKLASSAQASFDQGGQNSGILGLAGNDGFWVTPHFVDRYNGLISAYGNRFSPPLNPSQGVYSTPTNTFIVCASAMEHFATMNRWRKQGAPPWLKQ